MKMKNKSQLYEIIKMEYPRFHGVVNVYPDGSWDIMSLPSRGSMVTVSISTLTSINVNKFFTKIERGKEMKLKNKTQLRKIILSGIGNTGSLDYVETYADGTWEIMSCSSYSENCVDRRPIDSYCVDVHNPCGCDVTLRGWNKTITECFRDIEEKL